MPKLNFTLSSLLHYVAVSICFFILSNQVIYGQNLVPNPGFEEYEVCPTMLGDGGPLEAIPWYSTITGTCDYFNACNNPGPIGVPFNFQGAQLAHGGVAYAGGYHQTQGSFYREYLQVQLLDTLEAGVCYKIGMYANAIDEGCGGVHLSMLLSDVAIPNPLGQIPQIDWYQEYFNDTVNWQYVFGYYIAEGNEEFLTIGNFYNDFDSGMDPNCQWSFQYAYYYIDDVFILPTDFEATDIQLDGPIVECDSYTIIPDVDGDVFLQWSDGSTGPTLTVTESGTYSVTASYGCTTAEGEIEVTILNTTPVDVGPEFVSLCEGESYTISLDPDLGDYEWNDGSTATEYTITTPGIYRVTLTTVCNESTDGVEVEFVDLPAPFTLGEDTTLCEGDVINYLFADDLGDFEWQDGSDNPAFTITEGGAYSLTISNACGEETDEIEIFGMSSPTFDFGADEVTLCGNEAIDFDFDGSMGDFVWQDGSTNPFYHIEDAGLYGLTVTNSCGTYSDQIIVDQHQLPDFTLGPDIQDCEGGTYILDPGVVDGVYQWQDGSANQTFQVNVSGSYALTITNECGQHTDQVVINLIEPVNQPDLGPDQTLCPGEQLVLNAYSPGANYLWNDLSTSDTLLITVSGTYFVQVFNACNSFSDTIQVTVNNNPPDVQLPADFLLCQGSSATIESGVTGVNYLWNDGSSLPSLDINTPGTYILTVSNACGSDIDSVIVSAGGSSPTISLGIDTAICAGSSLTIVPASNNVTGYTWQDGSHTTTYQVTAPGIYFVNGINSCGNDADTIQIGLLPTVPVLSLGPDTIVCPGNAITLSILIPNVDILWEDGSAGQDFMVIDSGVVSGSISNVCGISADTIEVSFFPDAPSFNLGPDQSICPGETVIIDPGITGVNYLWQDGSTGSQIAVTQGSEIILTISNQCGSDTDTLLITASSLGPQLDLGPDVLVCEGEIVNIPSGISGVNYVWQDGSSANNFTATISGEYALTVSNLCGVDADTINVEISGVPPVADLGPDTLLCIGQSILLHAGLDPITSHQWQDGSIGSTFLVVSPGLYTLHESNRCGDDQDTITVSYLDLPGPVDLGKDTTLCNGESLLLKVNIDPSASIVWQDGSTDSTFLVTVGGTYSVQQSNQCGTTSDQVEVSFKNPPSPFDLGPDTSVCEGISLTIGITPDPDATLTWQDGSHTPNYLVTLSGTYTLQQSNACGLEADQITVIYEDAPEPFDLGTDTIICAGDVFNLSAPSTPYVIRWQDGSTGSSIVVNAAKVYSLELSNACGKVSDSLQVLFNEDHPLFNLEATIDWCKGDTIELDATQPFLAQYSWNTGANTPTISATHPGSYLVHVYAMCADSLQVVELVELFDCVPVPKIYIPNIFTPNDDGINDVFTVMVSADTPIDGMEGSIFDRWGNQIFNSGDNPFSWNGKFHNDVMMPGVYVYVIHVRYTLEGKAYEETFTGDVTLIR